MRRRKKKKRRYGERHFSGLAQMQKRTNEMCRSFSVEEKRAARAEFREAVSKGIIKRRTCEWTLRNKWKSDCGRWPTHGHHYDYAKPLKVLWLCWKHHQMIHGFTKEHRQRWADQYKAADLARWEKLSGWEKITYRS